MLSNLQKCSCSCVIEKVKRNTGGHQSGLFSSTVTVLFLSYMCLSGAWGHLVAFHFLIMHRCGCSKLKTLQAQYCFLALSLNTYTSSLLLWLLLNIEQIISLFSLSQWYFIFFLFYSQFTKLVKVIPSTAWYWAFDSCSMCYHGALWLHFVYASLLQFSLVLCISQSILKLLCQPSAPFNILPWVSPKHQVYKSHLH